MGEQGHAPGDHFQSNAKFTMPSTVNVRTLLLLLLFMHMYK